MGFEIPERYAGHAFIFLCTIFARLKTRWKPEQVKKEVKNPEFLDILHQNILRYDSYTPSKLANEFSCMFITKNNEVYKTIGRGYKLYLTLEAKKVIFFNPINNIIFIYFTFIFNIISYMKPY